MSNLIFIDKVPESIRKPFADKVISIAQKHRFNPNWLMGVINSETAGTFSPSIRNFAGSGATGLIQFMPSTARALGTTTDALARMDAVTQLDYVDSYIAMTMRQRKLSRIPSFETLYLAIFFPAAIGRDDTYIFPSWIYSQNAGMDINRDGKISMIDFRQFVLRKIPANRLSEFVNRDPYIMYYIFGAVIILMGIIGYYVFKRS